MGSLVIPRKRIQVNRTLVKVWVRFIEKSCIYLFIIHYLATTELRLQFRRTTAPFITNRNFKLSNQTSTDIYWYLLTSTNIYWPCAVLSIMLITFYSVICNSGWSFCCALISWLWLCHIFFLSFGLSSVDIQLLAISSASLILIQLKHLIFQFLLYDI